MRYFRKYSWLPALLFSVAAYAQHADSVESSLPRIPNVEPQPLVAQAARLNQALNFLGSSLSKHDGDLIRRLQQEKPSAEISGIIQQILDPYCIAYVNINPEARVKVTRGPAAALLLQGGWTTFLVKVHNEAGVNSTLQVESPQARPVLHMSMYPFAPHPSKDKLLSAGDIANRFLEVQMYRNAPMLSRLSGLNLEYTVVQIYCKDSGRREAGLAFNIGPGTQDIGFRNSISILFTSRPAVKVRLQVLDDDGEPAMASFVFTDGIERVITDSMKDILGKDIDYRFAVAQVENREGWYPSSKADIPKRLTGIYPLPSRRVAATDEYPDFFFEPQVYRQNGEHVFLPAGKYLVRYTRGPEYLIQTAELNVPQGVDSIETTFRLHRWINLSKLGYYSADHHIHAAGCSHYESPEEGVRPNDMWRQILGEDLNVGAVLAWGPGWYHQKEFFSGGTHPLSTRKNIMRYDVEVSGFPSSHAGHLVLLGLKEDDYPGTTEIEQWPSYTLPVLRWARSQGAITGYAHSGWGLQPEDEESPVPGATQKTRLRLPNYVIPKMDGIGANEYIVSLATGLVDFYSIGDTPAPWELNMWYHTLNCGFKPTISGETDFPCIYDERVGVARTYFQPAGDLSFETFREAMKEGRSYVSDGGSHIMHFNVNGVEAGKHASVLALKSPAKVTVSATVAALLDEVQTSEGSRIAELPLDRQPYWHIERARIGTQRAVRAELIVNGEAVDTIQVVANGGLQKINF
ncbi:MAG TPA: CehA/McbA family metallohydrolase, partial [Flavitalea sp.]|nr:CehA/McbA family metallohydrolase [Flavitalea sp.]